MLFFLLNDQNSLFVFLISEDIHENMHEKIMRFIVMETVLKTIGVTSLGQRFSDGFLLFPGVLEILSEGPTLKNYFSNNIKTLAALFTHSLSPVYSRVFYS